MVATMNIHKRFVVQFFIQLFFLFLIFTVILVSFSAMIGYSLMNEEMATDLRKADNSFFTDFITVQNGKGSFSEELKEVAKKQDGSLLLLTTKGDVIATYNSRSDVPAHFPQNQLAALLLPGDYAPIKYKQWTLEDIGGQPYLLLFGKKNQANILLGEIKAGVDWENSQLHLSAPTRQKIEKEKAWVHFINSTGKIVDQYGKSSDKTSYSHQNLVTLANNNEDSISLYFDKKTKQGLIVGVNQSIPIISAKAFIDEKISNGFLMVIVFLCLLLLLGSFWYATKFGAPLITMMKWIENLGKGVYEQPLDLHRRPMMVNKKGKLKRSYGLYKDLIGTLSQLTESLKENEIHRKKGIQTREEWISGISHDLKTPLSSISGYAQMLEADTYSWSEKETREFGKVIAEKSTYMMELLEDLTLTYRLRNNGLPITKEKVDMNEFIRRTIIHFINNPATREKEFVFQPYADTLFASVDPKWFQRILDNLISNAIKYNPPGTKIKVSISPLNNISL